MSIRRPRGPKPTLKHLAFLEAMRDLPDCSAEARALRASVLTLRLFDEWVLRGASVADGSRTIARATRAAVDELHHDSDLQFLLSRIVEGMLMLRDSDTSAVLPRLAALADLYRQRGDSPLAADVMLSLGDTASAKARVFAPTEAVA